MKTLCLFFLLSQLTFAQHFSELNGMEDYNENTNLFYRIYEYKNLGESIFSESRNIYNLNFEQNSDTLFFSDYTYIPPDPFSGSALTIYNYDFWDDDPKKYIYTGSSVVFSKQNSIQSPITFINRYDLDYPSHQNISGYAYVEISKNNDSILFGTNGFFIKSSDGGLNWNEHESDGKIFQSISSWSDSTLFFIGYGGLYKSTDGGQSTFLVDTAAIGYPPYNSNKFLYDQNSSTVYLLTAINNYSLSVSNNKGEAFTWSTIFTSEIPIYAAIDPSQSGHIYLARDKFIYKSTNYGNSFEIIKQFERKLVGIYKKPNSEKLYAADKYKIYEIENDSVKIIKQLPIPAEVFDWFPLAISNKWIYDSKFEGDGPPEEYTSKREVVDIINYNGKKYFKIEYTNTREASSPSYQYYRVDSSDAKIYWAYFYEDTLASEDLYLDLIAEVGDTISFGNGIILESENYFNELGLASRVREYTHILSPEMHLHLVKGLGRFYELTWELVGNIDELKGAKINGVVYGDTTLVGIDDEKKLPNSFELFQNYPNPFNPTTSIKYSVPSLQFTIIKVYDVLGNEVATLVNEQKSSGEYEVEFDASNLSSGIYFYRLNTGSFSSIKKMIYLK
jgi:hypothetical protein